MPCGSRGPGEARRCWLVFAKTVHSQRGPAWAWIAVNVVHMAGVSCMFSALSGLKPKIIWRQGLHDPLVYMQHINSEARTFDLREATFLWAQDLQNG
eukprot:scaffold56905_cov31-Prasinocladus_malaysianus.AAC.1